MRSAPSGALCALASASLLALIALPVSYAAGDAPGPGRDSARHRPPVPAKAAASRGSDFNGDGFPDLAVAGSGVVSVIYGTDRGLAAVRNQQLTAADFPSDGPLPSTFPAGIRSGDFDGDGSTDLAIAAHRGQDDPDPTSAQVRIIYGSPTGLDPRRTQTWSPDTPGVPGTSAPNGDFGSSMITADFGNGPEDDLAVGERGSAEGRGSVTVLYGSPDGLTARGSQGWSQGVPGVPGRPAAGEQFGASLAAASFSGGPYADLAIGVPYDGIRSDTVEPDFGVGAVTVLRGSAAGLSTRGAQLWRQSTRGVKGKAEDGDLFGSALAAGHFSGRTAADLAIGTPFDSAARANGGAVNILRGSSRGLSSRGDVIITRRTPGLQNPRRLDQGLGGELTSGNFGHDVGRRVFDDLAVSATNDFNEGIGKGVVQVLYGSRSGLSGRHSQSWTWTTGKLTPSHAPLSGDQFGLATRSGDFIHGVDDSYDDLAVADYFYEAGRNRDGAVAVLRGRQGGLTSRGHQLWTTPALGRTQPRFFVDAYLGSGTLG